MSCEGVDQVLGDDGDSILAAFAVADADFAAVEVDVLDAEPAAFEQAQSGSVQERGHELVHAGEMGEQGSDFGTGEHDGNALGFLGAHEVVEPLELHVQHVSIQEHERAECLALRRGADAMIGGEARKEALDLVAAELARVAAGVKVNEATNPVHIRLFRARAALPEPKRAAHFVQ